MQRRRAYPYTLGTLRLGPRVTLEGRQPTAAVTGILPDCFMIDAQQEAVLNVNYFSELHGSMPTWPPPGPCMHDRQKKHAVTAMDIAKQLFNLDFYAPVFLPAHGRGADGRADRDGAEGDPRRVPRGGNESARRPRGLADDDGEPGSIDRSAPRAEPEVEYTR